MTTPRIPCEYHLIRYVPDVVKGEFTNIGVLLREANPVPGGSVPRVRFTRDWSRVRCVHADADIDLLESLEAEILSRLQAEQHITTTYPKPILPALTESLSNSIQISEPRVCLAENLTVELDQLMRLYVEPMKVRVTRQTSGRTAIAAAMRTAFEKTGAWSQMRKRIPASQYTRQGDPMRLDCGYGFQVPDTERETASRDDIIRLFHAVSLASHAEAAKSLSFSAPQLRAGVLQVAQNDVSRAGRRWIGLDFSLTAVVEPLDTLSPRADDEEPSDEVRDVYGFGVSTMESAGIRVLTTSNLPAAAERARAELQI